MRRWLTLVGAVAVLALAGCGGESHQDLRAWMAEQGKGVEGQARPAAADEAVRAVRVQRVRPARSVQAAQDRADERRQQARAGHHAPQGAARGVSARVAQHGRHAASRARAMYALVRTPEKDVYQVRQGNYLGQNFGVDHRHRPTARSGSRNSCRTAPATGRSGPARCNSSRPTHTKTQGAKKMSAVRLASTRIGPRARGPPGGRVARRRAVRFAAAGAGYAQGANSIDSLTVSKGTSGRTIVKFTLKAPPANPPAGFAIASPPRIALDFLDTGNGLGATQRSRRRSGAAQPQRRPGGQPHARRLQPQQAADLRNAGRRQRGAGHAVRPEPSGSMRSTQIGRSASPKPRPGDVAHALRDVDFRRGKNGEGRIVVDLSDNATGIDIRQQGKTLIVDFIKTYAAAQSRAPARRRRISARRSSTVDTFSAGRQRADGHRAEGPVGALGLPDRQPLHPRGQAGPGRSEQADAGHAAAATRARSCRSTSRTSKCARCCR